MNYCKNIFFISIVCATITSQLTAQPTNLKFDHIGFEQGLSQSTVYAIMQDAYGFMWFGTQDGLNRYDGYSIIVYKHDPSNLNTISADRINRLLSDTTGDLWIGTSNGGLNRYVLNEDKFYHYSNQGIDSLTISNNTINTLFEDSEGNLWIGTNEGLNRYNRVNNTFTRFYFDQKNISTLNGNSITAVCEDLINNLWVGTYNGLFRMNLRNDSDFIKINNLNTSPTTINGDNVTSMYIDRSGSIWVGTYNTFLRCYNKNSTDFDLRYYSESPIKAIYEDNEGNLWLGSPSTELIILDSDQKGLIESNSRFKPESFNKYRINTIYQDKSGIIWIGGFNRGVYVYDQKKNHFNHYLDDPQNPYSVFSILEAQSGDIWAGTFGNGLIHFNKKREIVRTHLFNTRKPNSINSDKIFAICESSNGILWFGTIGEGLYSYDKVTGTLKHYTAHSPPDNYGLSNKDISSLYEGKNGDLWIGNVTGGIDLLNKNKGVFTHYCSEESRPNLIGGGRSITAIREDEKGLVWIGTLEGLKCYIPKLDSIINYQISIDSRQAIKKIEGILSLSIIDNIIWIGTTRNGLVKFDPGSTSAVIYTDKDGLPNNVVYGIIPDNSGNLWLSTNKGISQFSIGNKTFKSYDVRNGLQANEFNQGAYYRGRNGELFFGGINGFNSFFPDDINDNNYLPPVYLTTFRIFNKTLPLPNPIPNDSRIELTYFQNFFSFEFVALNYTSPEKNQYAYILEGFDNDWHLVSAQQRYASYTNLDPGKYVLRVKGSNNDGVWNEHGTSMVLIIKPPFWMTWWFRGIGVVLIMLLAYFIFRIRITKIEHEKELQQEISHRLIEKQEEERSRIALEMHDSLGQDLLFIKNRASSIIKKNFNIQTATENFNQISLYASRVLNILREISHNLRPPELDQLGLTETLRSILLTARESTTIEINGEVESIDGLIQQRLEINLVRIIQEALSNILKHSEATNCEIILTTIDNHIVLKISDNGKGFSRNNEQAVKKKSGLGLSGMTERVRILGGIFEINSAVGEGTRIEIRIPFNNETQPSPTKAD